MNDSLTYQIESNHDTSSIHCSLKLRLDENEQLIIGAGYRLSLKTYDRIVQNFMEIGFSPPQAITLAKARNLKGREAGSFINKWLGVYILTKEQELQLFRNDYQIAEKELEDFIHYNEKRYGALDLAQAPKWVKQILIDFWYTGSMSPAIADILFVALKASIKNHDFSNFEKLMYNSNVWKKHEISLDRMKLRCIYIREGQRVKGIVN